MATPGIPPRWPLLTVAVLIGVLSTSCAKDSTGPTPGAGGSAPTSAAPPSTAGNSTDYCALAERIGNESGIMVNKHVVPQAKETLDMFKALVNLSLAAKDQLAAGLPDNIKAAYLIVIQYFQMLKDSNYTAAPPAGFGDANKAVNDYGVSACGFVFDQSSTSSTG